MRGINYGHHWSAATYSEATARSEMKSLYDAGFKVIRIAYPTYNSSASSMNLCKQMVALALQLPFTKVIWGVVGHRSPFTAAQHQEHMIYLKTNIAPWAQAFNDSRLQISVGNEEEMAVDTNSLSKSDLQASLKQCMIDMKALYTAGATDYVTASTYQSDWYNLGLPQGTQLGMNLYYEWSPMGTFRISAQSMFPRFGNNAYVAEYSTEAGFLDATNMGQDTAENNWADNLSKRTEILETYLSADVPIIFFCYKDGSFGVPPNRFALALSDGSHRNAWIALTQNRTTHNRHSSIKSYSDRSY